MLGSGSRLRSIRSLTLVELLVVISVIALLLAILLPTVSRARRRSQERLCDGFRKKMEDYAFLDRCQAARAELGAFDMGCHACEMGGFELPAGVTPNAYRAQLEIAAERACR